MLVAALSVTAASAADVAGLHHEEQGHGEAVVLIHGFSLDRRMWEPQVPALAGSHRVIRYDLRGHGRSAAAEAPYSGHGDLLALLDSLGVGRATLVGLSAGAVIATDFALEHPARVARLVLAAPGLGGFRTPPLPWMAPVFEAAAAGNGELAAGRWAATPIMALLRDAASTDAVRQMVMDNARLWTMQRLEQPLSPPAIGRLGEIAAPTLVVVGTADLPHIQQVAGMLAHGIAGARLVTIDGAGHLVNLDAPAEFNAVLLQFLTGSAACACEAPVN